MASNDGRQQCMHVIDPKSNNVAEKHLYHWTKIMRSQVETTRIHRMEHQHNGIVPFIKKQTSMIEVFFAKKRIKSQFLLQRYLILRAVSEKVLTYNPISNHLFDACLFMAKRMILYAESVWPCTVIHSPFGPINCIISQNIDLLSYASFLVSTSRCIYFRNANVPFVVGFSSGIWLIVRKWMLHFHFIGNWLIFKVKGLTGETCSK